MVYTIQQIATALGAKAFGAVDLEVDGLAEPNDAGPRHLALAMTRAYRDALAQGGAVAAVISAGDDWQALGLKAAIMAPRPRHVMAGLTALFDPGQGWGRGVHPSAVIDPEADLGEGVSVGPLAVIGKGARIGRNSIIGPQTCIGNDARIGEGAHLREGVRIGARVVIGARFIAQPGAVIGGDGFSFVTPETSGVEAARASLGDQGRGGAQSWARIHSLGSVIIGDDVEIGANSTVDRGTIRDTTIGTGTKIDNLVMIGHNVSIGTDCLLCGHTGIAGSVRIGNNVVLAGKTGVSDNIFIGDNVITGGGTIVLANIPAGRVMLGYPAMKMETAIGAFKGVRRLRRLLDDVSSLKKTVSKPPHNT
ncbi:UDP-3-O-[3-hydroxymyristoyl] glucosamine N-acyltransferase [Roseovarius lutimaris]|uniref:UDP-3-O-acylglucosamine N-acyltransferase n=1 Tax=Roseovarius lutimaris TaxID=1005928 RepID=A0A1I4YKP4_9RHOB|nr:UDP-3-O-(3-hydroxymyristoyl)glucosamine N-acyltransferase [Roseovarius lutimaris]SFN38150.1 UDP-3-O-[3-hydroxymyristoyl] glucosamine N-acyltransferase [Roseovarius lutimaris]